MDAQALSIIETERADGFRNLGGTRLGATLPVTQRLVDMAVARAGARRNLHGLQVTLRADGEIGVEVVKPVLGFNARLGLVFRIAGPVDVASDPRVYLLVTPSLTWTAVSGLARAQGLAVDGVSIGRDGIAIDLRVLAARAGVEDLLALARTIELHGRAGALVAHVILEVPEGGIPGRAASDAHREPMPRAGDRRTGTGPPAPGGDGGRVPADVRTLLHELKGARVQGRVAVAENLVNAVIGVTLQSARAIGDEGRSADGEAPPPGADRREVEGSTLAGWIQRARVQFLNGRMALDLDVVIT